MTTADEDSIRSLVRVRPSVHLSGVRQELESVYGLFVSIVTGSRTLARMGVSEKSLSHRVAERNEELQTLWEPELAWLAILVYSVHR